MQNERDANFVLAAPKSEPLDALGESPDNCQADRFPSDIRVTSPLVTSGSPGGLLASYEENTQIQKQQAGEEIDNDNKET